jgi:hypothetical protein
MFVKKLFHPLASTSSVNFSASYLYIGEIGGVITSARDAEH